MLGIPDANANIHDSDNMKIRGGVGAPRARGCNARHPDVTHHQEFTTRDSHPSDRTFRHIF